MFLLLTASHISWHEETSNWLVTSINFISSFSNKYSEVNTQNIPSACFKLSSLKHSEILELNWFLFPSRRWKPNKWLIFFKLKLYVRFDWVQGLIIRLNSDYSALIYKKILCSLNLMRGTEHAVFNFCTSLRVTLVLSSLITNANVTVNVEL